MNEADETITESSPGTESDWDALHRELDAFARDLDAFPDSAAHAGASHTARDELRDRFSAIRSRVSELQARSRKREAGFHPGLDATIRREASLRREVMRRQRREKLKHGARDVGEGLVRAWGEMSVAMRKAATRMKDDGQQPGADTRNPPASSSTPPYGDR